MKPTEFRKLIREEVKKTLNEASGYSINITEIRPTDFNKARIQVGNTEVYMAGWEHEENKDEIAKIDSVMRKFLSAKRLSRKPAGEPDQPINKTESGSGTLYYEAIGSFNGIDLVNAMKQIEAMNIKYNY